MTTVELSEVMDTLARGIARAMGDGWTVDKVSEPSVWRTISKLAGNGDRYALSIYKISHENKIKVSGVYPQLPAPGNILDYIRKYNETLPEMGVSLDKSVAQIAKDIQRRLIPAYEAKRAEAWAAVARVATQTDQRKATVRRMEAVLGWSMRESNHGDTKYTLGVGHFADGYGDIIVSQGDSVTIELKSIPVGLGLQVAELLRKWSEEHKRD